MEHRGFDEETERLVRELDYPLPTFRALARRVAQDLRNPFPNFRRGLEGLVSHRKQSARMALRLCLGAALLGGGVAIIKGLQAGIEKYYEQQFYENVERWYQEQQKRRKEEEDRLRQNPPFFEEGKNTFG